LYYKSKIKWVFIRKKTAKKNHGVPAGRNVTPRRFVRWGDGSGMCNSIEGERSLHGRDKKNSVCKRAERGTSGGPVADYLMIRRRGSCWQGKEFEGKRMGGRVQELERSLGAIGRLSGGSNGGDYEEVKLGELTAIRRREGWGSHEKKIRQTIP